MKKNLMAYLVLSCKEATMMTAKKEERKLGMVSSAQLSMHLAMCKFCRRFYKTSKIIGSESKWIERTDSLPPDAKNRIQDLMNHPD